MTTGSTNEESGKQATKIDKQDSERTFIEYMWIDLPRVH